MQELLEREIDAAEADELNALVASLTQASEPEQAAALRELSERVDHPDPQVGSQLALAAGALVEIGGDPQPLALALIAPVTRALRNAVRLIELVGLREGDDDDGILIHGRSVSQASLLALSDEDPKAVRAFASLDIWYLPTVAAWSRCLPVLRSAAQSGELRDLLARFERTENGATWIRSLLQVPFDVPLVVLFPEIDEAYRVRVSGCVDMGQLTVLLADALAEPLERIGATEALTAEVLAVMRGEGEQQSNGGYSSSFHIYSWEAIDPSTGLPVDGRFEWLAPGGAGDHSLPADFELGSLTALLDDMPVLAIVGLSDTRRWTRIIPATRAFGALPARVADVRRLTPGQARRVRDAI